MWPMIAEPGLRCAECRHTIQPGRLCLSELPEETPAGVSRGDFRNYCIGCPQCWAQGKHACYVRYLDAGRSIGKTPRSLPCARCGRRIAAGEKAGLDIYYDWPGQNADEPPLHDKTALAGLATAASQAGILIRGLPEGGFNSLSAGLSAKFTSAGLRDGARTAAQAQAFYQDSVPLLIRGSGDQAVQTFLAGKDASHIQSVHNAPHLARDPSNILWESSSVNRARGAADMTGMEHLTAQSHNAFQTAGVVLRDCTTSATIAAGIGALLEAPVAGIENYIRYQKSQLTGEQAVKEAAKSIAVNAGMAAAGGFAVKLGITVALGTGLVTAPALAVIMPVLAGVGLAFYGLNAIKRILNALADGLPLHRIGTYFCSPRCHIRFAYETGKSALVRWEGNWLEANGV